MRIPGITTCQVNTPKSDEILASKISIRLRWSQAAHALRFVLLCNKPQTARGPNMRHASMMREARSSQVPVEKRVADYLQAAAMTAPCWEAALKGHPPVKLQCSLR